jgi:hypothetical protein
LITRSTGITTIFGRQDGDEPFLPSFFQRTEQEKTNGGAILKVGRTAACAAPRQSGKVPVCA